MFCLDYDHAPFDSWEKSDASGKSGKDAGKPYVYAAKNGGVATKNHEFSHHEKRGNGTSKVLEKGDGKKKTFWTKSYTLPANQQQKHLKIHGWKMIQFPFGALWTPPSKVPPFSSCQSLSVPAS